MKKNLKSYEVILFDIDDTLIDLRQSKKLTYKIMCNHFNRKYFEQEFEVYEDWENDFFTKLAKKDYIIPEKYKTFEEKNLFVHYTIFNYIWGISMDKTNEVSNLFTNIMRNNIVAMPNVEDTIKYLSQKYKLVIASNGNADLIKAKLEAANIYPYFDKIIMANDMRVYKPEASFFTKAMDVINYYDVSKMVMVGDSFDADVQGAINVGITPIWFNCRKEPIQNYKLKNGHIIYSFNELRNIL